MKSLSDFAISLEKEQQLIRIKEEVSSYLEITEISSRVLSKSGPALLFENVIKKDGTKSKFPVLTNLFSTRERILKGLHCNEEKYKELGQTLAFMKYPKPVTSIKAALPYIPLLKKIMAMNPKIVNNAECQEKVYLDTDINILDFPIQWCWPNEPAPLITWGLTITKDCSSNEESKDFSDYNVGIYRLQVLSEKKLIMRWLHHRGGAEHFKTWQKKHKNENMPVAIAIGADPAMILSGVIPLPENLSEYKFAGILRGEKTQLVKAKTVDLYVPKNAEIIIEGYVSANELADEGPYGDHTGYYNSIEKFPTVNITAITTKKNPIYLSTYTGRPPDEPSVLAETLNDIFVPLIKEQFPEIVDFYLVPDACSYRMAVVSIKKTYAGQSKRVAMGIWSYLKQFLYTKFIIVIDDDLDVKSNKDVIWAISTNVDPIRDVTVVEKTPMDYLDFSSEEANLASKMLIDATTKIYPETKREWGTKIKMTDDIIDLVTSKWNKYNIF